jgi:ssRNA-specific RNase YbeY (16S rRNA maturation enzyme)
MVMLFGTSRFKIQRQKILAFVQELLHHQQAPDDMMLNIIFVGVRKMKYIAKTYKHEEEALPVLTFPYLTGEGHASSRSPSQSCETQRSGFGEGESGTTQTVASDACELGVGENSRLLGEIFICYPQAVLLAAERNKRVDDIMKFLLEHAIDNLFKKSL